MVKLSIVVPCYNEELVIRKSSTELISVLDNLININKVDRTSCIYFVDDGSNDNTWGIVKDLSNANSKIFGIKLSRNFGHQNAILAGLLTTDSDVVVSLDADLQDDINVIESMVDNYTNGSEIVYAVRDDRSKDTLFKRTSAHVFYKIMSFLGSNVIYNHSDFRLLSRKAINALKEFNEVNLFLRGVIPLIGLQSSIVYYKRKKRVAGTTKYPLRKMISFAIGGIISFSIAPLRAIMLLGLLIFFMSLVVMSYIISVWLFSDSAVPGWASTTLPIYFLGGIQILVIGVIGEYLGRIYQETKGRPRYLIEEHSKSLDKTYN